MWPAPSAPRIPPKLEASARFAPASLPICQSAPNPGRLPPLGPHALHSDHQYTPTSINWENPPLYLGKTLFTQDIRVSARMSYRGLAFPLRFNCSASSESKHHQLRHSPKREERQRRCLVLSHLTVKSVRICLPRAGF